MTEHQSSTLAPSLKTHNHGDYSAPTQNFGPSGSEFLGLVGESSLTDIAPPPLPSSSHSLPPTSTSPHVENPDQFTLGVQGQVQQDVQSPHLEEKNQRYSTSAASRFSIGPQFRSALSYTEVRDYAYPEFHPLHYGVPADSDEGGSQFSDEEYEDEEYPDSYMRDGGPPWKEDSDLASPVVISHSVGDRISKEYEFSVASVDEIHGRAVALFDFIPENDNEAPLKEGQIIWVSYRHGQGWLVAEDPATGETGLVPEEYVQMISGHDYSSSQSSASLGDSEDSESRPPHEQPNDHNTSPQMRQLSPSHAVTTDNTLETPDVNSNFTQLPNSQDDGWVDQQPIENQKSQPSLPSKINYVSPSNQTSDPQIDDLTDSLQETQLK